MNLELLAFTLYGTVKYMHGYHSPLQVYNTAQIVITKAFANNLSSNWLIGRVVHTIVSEPGGGYFSFRVEISDAVL